MAITWTPMPNTKTLRRNLARSTAVLLRTYAADPELSPGWVEQVIGDVATLARLEGMPVGWAANRFTASYAQGPVGQADLDAQADEAGELAATLRDLAKATDIDPYDTGKLISSQLRRAADLLDGQHTTAD
jgi:hypothetical protein